MKSPFPGMDPYLERHWRDVHHRLCTYACDAIQPQVQPALLARIEERLVIESDISDFRSIYPDVKIVEDQPDESTGGVGTLAIAATEPLVITSTEPSTEGYIQILDPSADGRVVTVIEFLSTTNKTPGPGRDDYRKKMAESLQGGASLVEIDLLRTGDWVIQVPPGRVPKKHRQSYKACVRRAWDACTWEFYPMPMNARLSTIRIPLRKGDKDAVLDLQSLVDLAYKNGAYHRLNYETPLDPPFDPTTAAWAAKRVRDANGNQATEN